MLTLNYSKKLFKINRIFESNNLNDLNLNNF